MKTDGIIFDLDGTLWDSRQQVADAWNITLKRLGEDFRMITVEDLTRTMGMLMEDIFLKLFPHLPREKVLEAGRICCDEEVEYVAGHAGLLYDGVRETLKDLSGRFPLAVASNCQAGYIEALYPSCGLGGYFKDRENPGRTGLPKADNIRLVAERNGMKSPVYVGDTAGDADASRKAGVPFIYASYGFGSVEEYAARIDSFRELAGLFD